MKKYIIILVTLVIMLIPIASYFLFQKDIFIEVIENEQKINIGSEIEIPKAKALYCRKILKNSCKDITNLIRINNNINNNIIGKYQITYSINYKNIKKEKTIEIEINDMEAPVIKLNDENKLTLCPNANLDKITDYTVTDNFDIEISKKVKLYLEDNNLIYSATDSSGNSTQIKREIEIIDKDTPSITLNGSDYLYIKEGSNYEEPGFIAYDNCDGNITSRVKTKGNVNTNLTGEYKITYEVEDSSGNKTQKIRKIYIYNKSIGENIQKNGKIVYLTFDDGPNSYTENILNVLRKYDVKATFFVTNQFSKYNYIIKNIYEDGHSIGIHSYSHIYKNIYQSENAFFEDINKMDNIIYNQTGIHTNLTRFPGGSSNTVSKFNNGIMTRLAKLLIEKNYKYFDWNVDSKDTSTSNPNTIANNVINSIKNKNASVVLMHDIKSYNAKALEKIIQYGLTNGYTFLPLDENSPTAHHRIAN